MVCGSRSGSAAWALIRANPRIAPHHLHDIDQSFWSVPHAVDGRTASHGRSRRCARRLRLAVGALAGRLKQSTEKEKPMRTKPHRTFSESDKAAWRAAKQQRLTDLGEQLKREVASVQDSDAFKRYLAAQAVFHRYSARNVFLLFD